MNYSKLLATILLFFSILIGIHGQKTYLHADSIGRNEINIELLGAQLLYSFNYERSFYRECRFDVKVKAGMFIAPFTIEGFLDYQSMGVNIEPKIAYNFKRSTFEFGIGYTYIYLYGYLYNDLTFYNDCCSDFHFLVPRIGYKWHWNTMSRYLGIAFTPLFATDLNEEGDEWSGPTFLPYGGISFGIRF